MIMEMMVMKAMVTVNGGGDDDGDTWAGIMEGKGGCG